jgi:ketosteroid isomerase-like protein
MPVIDPLILEANERFYRAFASGDVGGMDAVWAREVPVACVHPGWTALEGRQAVMTSWERIFEAEPGPPDVRMSDAAARLVGEAAIVVCLEHLEGTTLVATNVFVREQGEWRITHHHASAVRRGQGPTTPSVVH